MAFASRTIMPLLFGIARSPLKIGSGSTGPVSVSSEPERGGVGAGLLEYGRFARRVRMVSSFCLGNSTIVSLANSGAGARTAL